MAKPLGAKDVKSRESSEFYYPEDESNELLAN